MVIKGDLESFFSEVSVEVHVVAKFMINFGEHSMDA